MDLAVDNIQINENSGMYKGKREGLEIVEGKKERSEKGRKSSKEKISEWERELGEMSIHFLSFCYASFLLLILFSCSTKITREFI